MFNFKLIPSILFLIFSIYSSGQEINNDDLPIEKNCISGNILGAGPIIGITYERILSEELMGEVGLGLVGIGAGITFYPLKIKVAKLCPYTGLKFAAFAIVDWGGNSTGYIPFGLTFFFKRGFNIGFDFGPAVHTYNPADFPPDRRDDPIRTFYGAFGNMKLGVRFR